MMKSVLFIVLIIENRLMIRMMVVCSFTSVVGLDVIINTKIFKTS